VPRLEASLSRRARASQRAVHRAPGLPTLRGSSGRGRHARVLPGPLPAALLGIAGGGLALLGAVPDAAVSPGVPAIAAQQVRQPVPVDLPREVDERASRSRRTIPQPEALPAQPPAPVPAPPPPAPVLPGCDPAAGTPGGSNGRLPDRVLCTLPGDSGERLRADAAVSFVVLAQAYEQHFGRPICVTDGHRTLGEQQQLRRLKPRFAARPGTSEHGWGLAVDLSCGVQSFRTPQHAWLVDNAGRFGWYLPDWAQRDGSRPEPWHWEYRADVHTG
jgi:hypothetical protein